MLRTNLATRPFYNERAVHLVIALAALVVGVITVLNVARIVALSRHNTELSSRVSSQQAEAARLTKEAAAIRKTINRDELDVVVKAAREANALIDQRTFSWTSFFNAIESTLPPDVMLTSVRPTFDGETTKVSMAVLARRAEDVDELMEKLEATGAFEDIVPAAGDKTEAGLYRVLLHGTYVAPSAEQPSAAAPAGAALPPAAPASATGGRR